MPKEIFPNVVVDSEVRLPKVLFDHGVDINGWHEGNTLFSHVWEEIEEIRKFGVEKYVQKFFYNKNKCLELPHIKSNPTIRGNGLEYISSKLIKEIESGRIKTALDVGCGQGQAGIWFRTAGVDYVGIDISLVNIGFAYALLPCFKYLSKLEQMPKYYVMLGENLKFEDKSFDIALCCHALEHMHDFNKAFSEQIRVAKEVCGVVPFPHEDESGAHMYKFSKKILEDFLRERCVRSYVIELEKEFVYWGEVV